MQPFILHSQSKILVLQHRFTILSSCLDVSKLLIAHLCGEPVILIHRFSFGSCVGTGM